MIVRADGARGNVTAGLPLQHHSASGRVCASMQRGVSHSDNCRARRNCVAMDWSDGLTKSLNQ
ncbi:hypothetical protein CJU94_20270 [Paraburkholderia aromaticivorans]|uniref:Uncharacterized protein n=1 Tax=Paraburkholderia aromaticivorans TaxID=2026199 RepID=A0A248VP10_9BURK|nr:hypothetical protein CJU94_20270 [Paraburkholderia aromaticivorans]